jgi:hypothetical protein
MAAWFSIHRQFECLHRPEGAIESDRLFRIASEQCIPPGWLNDLARLGAREEDRTSETSGSHRHGRGDSVWQ